MINNLGHENQDIRSIYCMKTAYIVLTTNNLLFKDANILIKMRLHQEEKRMFKLKCTCVCVPNIKLEWDKVGKFPDKLKLLTLPRKQTLEYMTVLINRSVSGSG